MADSGSFSAAQRRVSMQNRTAMRYTDMSNRFMNGGVQPNRRNMPSPTNTNRQPIPPAPTDIPESTSEPPSEQENKPNDQPCGDAVPNMRSAPTPLPDPISLAKNFLAGADTEKLLIAALLLLLCSEGADMILIAALLYIFID